MQQRMRTEAPCIVGAVYRNPQEVTVETLQAEMRRIRETGFTFVRFHAVVPEDDPTENVDFTKPDLWVKTAKDAGLKVFLHFSPHDIRRTQAIVKHYRQEPAIACWLIGGEPHASGLPLATDADRQAFLAWLQKQHDSPAAVHRAWAIYPDRLPAFVSSWDDALRIAGAITKGDGLMLATPAAKHEVYGAMRDLMRFRADQMHDSYRATVKMLRELDPNRPIWIGNHQLFINNPQLGWDIAGSARLADVHYTSIHLSWHFELFEGEVDRPLYFESRFTNDAFKGGVTSAYETTGGPVQYSGGYGNHIDAGLMRRFMFSYLAAGNETIAFWDWVCRPGGIEAGEYGLVTLSGKLSPWAREAGRIALAMDRYREELWHTHEEPELAILRSWDTEAITALEPRRFDSEEGPSELSRGCGQQHIRALIGASRAAVNHHVAFEYLTEAEVLAGLALVYPAIYLPHVRACSTQLLEALLAYVQHGGRLLADVQLAFHDQWGKLQPRGRGTLVEKLFGAWVDSFHDARTRPQFVNSLVCEGFYGDIETTSARVLRRFADGRPAVTEANIGRGQAVLMGFDPARQCWKPGQDGHEALLADLYRGDAPRRWWSDAPLVYRRSHPKADHWFLINDGPVRSALLRVWDRQYRAGKDAVSETALHLTGTLAVDLPERSAVWLR